MLSSRSSSRLSSVVVDTTQQPTVDNPPLVGAVHHMKPICQRMEAMTHNLLQMHPVRILVLSFVAGSFVSVGASLSIALALGNEMPQGTKLFMMGVGLYIGFSMLILSGAVLFTQVNIWFSMYLAYKSPVRHATLRRMFAYWFLVWVGNILGTLLIPYVFVLSEIFGQDFQQQLQAMCQFKLFMHFTYGTPASWFKIVLSAMVGNWLVGMAVIFAVAGETTTAKLLSIFGPVVSFVVLGVQHSVANMAYLHLNVFLGDETMTFGLVWAWNLFPACLGNMLGGIITSFVFYYACVMDTHPHNWGLPSTQTDVKPNIARSTDGAESDSTGLANDKEQ